MYTCMRILLITIFKYSLMRNTVPVPHHDIQYSFGQEKTTIFMLIQYVYVSYTICVKWITSCSNVRFRNFQELQ